MEANMHLPFIWLRPEITRSDALMLMDWLEDPCITRYLSDSRDVSRHIERIVGRLQLPVLTHLFNQGGRFFMACDGQDARVGFVRLVPTGPACEIVLAIGSRDTWGRGYGMGMVLEAMKLTFFEMRTEKLVARILPDNTRSLKLFERCGFLPEARSTGLVRLALTKERYRCLLREGHARHGSIRMTETDQARLRQRIAFAEDPAHFALEHELERAIGIDARQLPRDVVTMNSRVVLRLDDESIDLVLAYPDDAHLGANRLSVCADLGTAILGQREGDAIEWRISGRVRRLRIGKVLYQPEAAGDFHL